LTEADADDLQSVYAAASDYFQQVTSGPPAPGQAQHDLAEAATDEGRHLLGIYLSDEPVGVVDLRLADPGPFDVRLGLILLARTHRHQGLGSWALRILEEWLRQATPSRAMVLRVPARDHAAQAFFRSHGYTFTGQATRVPAGGSLVRILQMRKALG
jgi:GNAT superfamily N-acetyltransferase